MTKKYSAIQLNNMIKKWDAMILSYEGSRRESFKHDQDYIEYLENKLEITIGEIFKVADLLDDLIEGQYIKNKYFSKEKTLDDNQ